MRRTLLLMLIAVGFLGSAEIVKATNQEAPFSLSIEALDDSVFVLTITNTSNREITYWNCPRDYVVFVTDAEGKDLHQKRPMDLVCTNSGFVGIMAGKHEKFVIDLIDFFDLTAGRYWVRVRRSSEPPLLPTVVTPEKSLPQNKPRVLDVESNSVSILVRPHAA
jgi:hypothetical protein